MGFRPLISAVLVCIFASTITKAGTVQFNFSASEVEISEGGNLPSRLSIVKTGEHEGNISIRVSVTTITPNNNDYIANDDHTYVFTSDTRQLPIQTQLQTDRSGEGIERFNISLLPLEMMSSVEIVIPSIVTVIIIDDDTVVIGFTDSNMPAIIVEGGPPQRVNINVKQEGLRLDVTDLVQIDVRICSGSEVQLIGGTRLQFRGNSITQFTTISAIDNDFSDGKRLAQLCISVHGAGNSVPAQVYPSSIPIQVMDNDVIHFQLSINTSANQRNPQEPTTIIEGDSLENLITLSRCGLSDFSYNVTLKVESLNDPSDALDLILRTEYTFENSTNEMDILSVPLKDDDIPEKKKQFNVSIKSIRAFSPENTTLVRIDALASIEGEPITFVVYDNDFNIGFVNGTALVPEGSFKPLCVSVFDIEPSDIDPRLTITLQIAAYNTTSEVSQDYLNISTNRIWLNFAKLIECFTVGFPMDNDECNDTPREFIIQLTCIDDQGYTVNFRQQNVTVRIDDAQDCAPPVVFEARVAVPIIVIITLAILIIIILIVALLILYQRHKSKREYSPSDMENKDGREDEFEQDD